MIGKTLAHFQREAHLLASMNHPNIAAIYGLEEADGKRVLAVRIPNEHAPSRIDLITNWFDELERLFPK